VAQTQMRFRAAKDIVFKEHEELLKDLDDRILKEIE
jgi:hypothetical protein